MVRCAHTRTLSELGSSGTVCYKRSSPSAISSTRTGGANHTHKVVVASDPDRGSQHHPAPRQCSVTCGAEMLLASERRDPYPGSRGRLFGVAAPGAGGRERRTLWAELEHPRQADAGRGRSFDLGAALRPGRRRHQDTTIPDAAWPSVVMVAGGPSPSAADVVNDALACSEIHHIREWEFGGGTELSNLVMLFSVHHREIHSSGWSVRIATDGSPEFIPPLWIDIEQKPRRIRRHRYRMPTGHCNP
jgi:hypothetical protein